MEFIVNKESDREYTLPESLTTIEKINPNLATVNREFNFQGTGDSVSINGQQMDMHRIDVHVKLGDTEIWEIGNFTGQTHPFHAHGSNSKFLTVMEILLPPMNPAGKIRF